jgi:type VI protein secretion system component VasK
VTGRPLAEVAVAIVWSVCCFYAGIIIGVRLTHRSLTEEIIMEARGARAWLARMRRRVSILNVVAVLMAGLAVQGFYSQHRANEADRNAAHAATDAAAAIAGLQAQNDCLAKFGNRLYDSLHPRQHVSKLLQRADGAYTDAFVNLLEALLVDHAPQAVTTRDALAVKAAAEHKQAVSARLNAERAKTPYPRPPRRVCPTPHARGR